MKELNGKGSKSEGGGGEGEESAKIGRYMRNLLANYDNIRGKNPKDVNVKFWDLVVISASDASQEAWYKAQLHLKLQLGDIPDVEYLCMADPEGPRIGSGGATLAILSELKERFKDKLFSSRILIIHSGGYSKRLPSHSCSGKIFSPLPIKPTRGGPYQMLDLKLCLYLPFLEKMEPGVFVTASDDIEVFNIDRIPDLVGGEEVVALAHPSNLFIGTTHGVYVMKDADTKEKDCLVEVHDCSEVLQKPSVELMRERGAILGSKAGLEQVFSDSAFWFHHQTTTKLINLYKENSPLVSELCIYGDFLTLLGSRPEKHFMTSLQQEKQSSSRDLKLKLGKAVGKTPLRIIKLNTSKFYHLGTSKEYLEGLTEQADLREELNLATRVYAKLTTNTPLPLHSSTDFVNCSRANGSAQDDNIHGVILNSSINKSCAVHRNAVVEYSIIKAKVTIGRETILSNVVVESEVDIPSGFLFHTIPARVEEVTKFVTIAFGVEDDLKGSAKKDSIKYGGRQLQELGKVSGHFSPGKIFQEDGKSPCLWTARLFPACRTMGESFAATAQLVNSFLGDKKTEIGDDYKNLYSMDDILSIKDCTSILEYRKQVTKMCADS